MEYGLRRFNMIYADNTKGIVSLTLKEDEQLVPFMEKLLSDGYWVHMLQRKDNKVIIEIKGA